MNNLQLLGLKKSIEKWEGIVNRSEVDDGTNNCQLCIQYFDEIQFYYPNACSGCPVSESVGLPGCKGTPYIAWAKYQEDSDIGDTKYKVFDDHSKKLAQDELDFLRSLLPTGKQ
jgi:hypothetical protein